MLGTSARARVCAVTLALASTLVPAAARQSSVDVDLFVPSTAAGATGVAVRVTFPATPRYADGAPIAIFVAGGGDADAYRIRDYASGVVAITFAFPSGELRDDLAAAAQMRAAHWRCAHWRMSSSSRSAARQAQMDVHCAISRPIRCCSPTWDWSDGRAAVMP